MKEKEKNGEKYFYFSIEKNSIFPSISKNIIRKFNREYTNNEDNFYEIYTKIKLFDKLDIDEETKNKICLIDLPDYGTFDFNEKSRIYSNFMDICSSFIFVIKNLTIDDINDENNLNRIFTKTKFGNAL